MGLRGVLLSPARGEPGAGPVPEEVEQPSRRLPEDQGVGGADIGWVGVVLGHEE